MTGQELATAVQYGAPIVVLVVDNGMYGTIRMHQERHYPGRVCGTELANPDFVALARSFGGARRARRADRGLPGGARARAGGRRTGGAPPAGRSGGAHARGRRCREIRAEARGRSAEERLITAVEHGFFLFPRDRQYHARRK